MPNDLGLAEGGALSAAAARRGNVISGVMLVGLGAAVAYTATGYKLGTLTRMGPGFVPAALGAILAVVGVILLASTLVTPRTRRVLQPGIVPPVGIAGPALAPARSSQWRGWICICCGVLLFAGLAEHTGLIPATIVSVFVTALGDRENTLRSAVLLALGMAVGAAVVFWWGLGVLLPLVEWNFG